MAHTCMFLCVSKLTQDQLYVYVHVHVQAHAYTSKYLYTHQTYFTSFHVFTKGKYT